MEKKLTASQEGVTLSIQEQGECQKYAQVQTRQVLSIKVIPFIRNT